VLPAAAATAAAAQVAAIGAPEIRAKPSTRALAKQFSSIFR